jgi:hypothetical protein
MLVYPSHPSNGQEITLESLGLEKRDRHKGMQS